MNLSIVKDVFSEGAVSVLENDTLSHCLSLIKKDRLPALAVFDNKGRHKGVIAPRWIIRSRLDPSTTKAKNLMRSAPRVALNDSLSKISKLMIECDIRKLPVYSEGKLLGFVTDEDVIRGAVKGNWGKNLVEEVMTKNPIVVDENNSIGSVLSLFRDKGFSHAPVVSNGKLVGMISISDVIDHVFQPRERQKLGKGIGEKIGILSIPLKGVMTRPVITILPQSELIYAAKKMFESEISSLVVLSNEKPIGIVTKKDFLELIAQIDSVDRGLTLQFSIKDIEMNGVQRNFIMDDFKSLARKYEELLEEGTLFVYMKTHGTNYKGNQLIHCRLKLRTRKGSFFSSSEGWSVEEAFSMALDRLDRQILKNKEFEYDSQYVKKYLKRIRFPLTEL